MLESNNPDTVTETGGCHFKIEKKAAAEGEAPISNVYPLSEDQRVREIARMLGGLTITQKTLDHAREMLRR